MDPLLSTKQLSFINCLVFFNVSDTAIIYSHISYSLWYEVLVTVIAIHEISVHKVVYLLKKKTIFGLLTHLG